MWTDAAVLVFALLLLALGADLLVQGSVLLARRLEVSPFFIGLTIVGFGTSTPELFTSLTATLRGQPDIALGNVVGSNIFNIAVILGLTALVAPIRVRLDLVHRQAWTVLGVSLAPFLALAVGRGLSRLIGALLLGFLAFYVWRGYREGRRAGAAVTPEDGGPSAQAAPRFASRRSSTALSVARVAGGLLLLGAGSGLLVQSASQLARAWGVSELVIGLTVVAGGTSAPELFTSLVAALRRLPDVALGNVLGSNVFNVAGILGLAWLLDPRQPHPQVLHFDAPLMVAVSAALIPILRTGARISRGEGAALLAVYGVYLWALLSWAPLHFAR